VTQGAAVKVENQDTGIAVSTITNAAGLFLAPDLKPGVYRVSVSLAGFETTTKAGITLRVQDHIPVDFDLHVVQASSSVQVESQAAALQTEHAPERTQLLSAVDFGSGDIAGHQRFGAE
jgi:hypothetical protein